MSAWKEKLQSTRNATQRWRTAAVIGLVVVAAVACADDGPWQKPNVSAEQAARDRAACRREATTEVERDMVLSEERGSRTRDSRTKAYMAQMNRFSAGRDRNDLFDRCMALSGYSRRAGTDPKSRFEAQSAPQPEPQPEAEPR